MKKILSLLIMLCLISASAMAELKLGDRASIENCREFVSLRAEPDTSSECISELKLNTAVNILDTAPDGFMLVETGGKSDMFSVIIFRFSRITRIGKVKRLS